MTVSVTEHASDHMTTQRLFWYQHFALGTAVVALTVIAAPAVSSPVPQDTGLRPMTFVDHQEFATPGSWTPSPDGEWMLYTVSTPNWQQADSQSDIHLVSMTEGLSSHRQLTFTEDSNETSPQWGRDGSFFVFLSDREGDANQIYYMRLDGGEARRITDASEGVSDFAFSDDGTWLAYRSGKSGSEPGCNGMPICPPKVSGQEQLYRLRVFIDSLSSVVEQITDTPAGIESWKWAPGSEAIYFSHPDHREVDNDLRIEAGFTVDIKEMETPLSNLWKLDLNLMEPLQLTGDPNVSVTGFNVSHDGRWVTFAGGSANRYERNITNGNLYGDQYLLEVATGNIERLTDNYEVPESGLQVSPDGRRVVFTAPDDMTGYSMTDNRVYVRETADNGGSFEKLGSGFDGDVGAGRGGSLLWSEDGNTVYFGAGVDVTTNLHALDIGTGEVRRVTDERAVLSVSRDDDSGAILIDYSDPTTPATVFTVPSIDQVADRSLWIQLVDANPQVRNMALGEETEINWTSTDGKPVGGILIKPVGYVEGERYPLVVIIHGGPASADQLTFNRTGGSTSAQVYAGAGYAVLKPNYRGSRNYGNAHRTDIVGDYFTLGFDDIMTGVDYLIAEGIADADRMGALGWSAGGHWSNWITTHTDRFKAISSGAGTMNWVSMYAQSDVQRNRKFYVGDDFMYENFEPYWNQSPLKYIANASTPTMIHVVEGDPRVPMPQSVELYMGLKKLGVPTELFMYPGRSHGIIQTRNRLLKCVSEMAWMDHYVRGIGDKFEWRDVLETLELETSEEQAGTGLRVSDSAVYIDGFAGPETSFANEDIYQREWRWMSRRGVVEFRNPRGPSTLYLRALSPVDFTGGTQTVTIKMGEKEIGSFERADSSSYLVNFDVPSEGLGDGDWVEFTIEADKFFVPAKVTEGSTDTRELGLQVFWLYLERLS